MSMEPVVTTSDLTAAERRAWEVAVERGLAITAADLRALLAAAASNGHAPENPS